MSEIVAELDFPDLATFQREGEESVKDAELVELWRALDSIEMERPGHTELLETAVNFG
jgi:hypothetical protein